MSSVVIAGNTSGSVTLSAPDVAGTTTLTLPSTSGTVLTSATTQAGMPSNIVGNGPAFSAYRTSSQSISSSTFTKISFNAEEYDTNSNFASPAFTPTVAGYYLIGAGYNAAGGGVPSRTILDLYKNGNQVRRLFDTSTRVDNASGMVMLYMNGSTDYLEVYAYIVASSPQIYSNGGPSDTFFTGVLVRAA